MIEFKLNTKLELKEFKIIKGNNLLSAATIEAIKNVAKYFPKVKKNLYLRVPKLFQLN